MESRVLYLLGPYPRWSETFIRRDLTLLQALGLPLTVAAVCHGDCELRENWPRATYLAETSVPASSPHTPSATRSAVRRACPRGLRDMLSLAARRPERKALAGLIARTAPTHLHAEFADLPALLISRAAQRFGLSFSVGVHARDIFTCKYEPAALFDRASFVTVCNRAAFDRLVSLCPRVEQQAHLIPHGLELGDWPFRQDPRQAEVPARLLFVGRFVRKKGVPVLLRALARLKNDAVSVRLTLVGDGPERASLEIMARNLTVDGLLDWAGVVPSEDVRGLLHQSDCLVVPSVVDEEGDRDGIPNVVLEAMASGTPVVASDVGGIPEAVGPDTGWLCSPGVPRELADAIAEAVRNPGLAAEKGRMARKLTEDQFDAAKLVHTRFRLFAQACGLP